MLVKDRNVCQNMLPKKDCWVVLCSPLHYIFFCLVLSQERKNRGRRHVWPPQPPAPYLVIFAERKIAK